MASVLFYRNTLDIKRLSFCSQPILPNVGVQQSIPHQRRKRWITLLGKTDGNLMTINSHLYLVGVLSFLGLFFHADFLAFLT